MQFTCDNAVLPGVTLMGVGQFASPIVLSGAVVQIIDAPLAGICVVGLYIAGVLSSATLTLAPASPANQTVTFVPAVTAPAGSVINWKVVSFTGTSDQAARRLSIFMQESGVLPVPIVPPPGSVPIVGSFSVSDLGISQTDLDKITRTLTNLGATDPIGSAIAEQTQRVRDYTLRYVLDGPRTNRLIRPLVLYQLYMQLPGGKVPDNIAAGYKDAMDELKDIRAGKFADVLQANPLPVAVDTTHQGSFGSNRKVRFGRGE